jgi:rhodanese-related sulfurtransferase
VKYLGRRRVRVVNSKAISFVFKSVLFLTALYLCVVDLPKLQVAYAFPYTNIDVDTAYNMLTSGLYPDLVVLDVRTQTEYVGGHICGAVLIPVSELEARIGELAGHENHEIIVYCKSGGRSATASGILDSHGFTKVYNMLGGISAWKSAGYPVGIVCAPVASFTWVPSTPKIGELVTFDASSSTPNGGTISKYEWDFGDGEYATGQIVTHEYSSLGIYTVTLNVTDSECLWDTEQKQIQVTVTTIPVGGYSIPIKGYTATKPLTLYLALVAILTASFTIAKRRKKQQN